VPAGCALSQGTAPRGRGCQQAQGTERETDVDSFGSFVQKPRGNVVGVIFAHVVLLLGTLLQRCVRHVAGQGNTQVAGQGNTQTSTQGTNTQTSTMPRTSRSSVGRRRSMGSSSSRPPVLFIAGKRTRGQALRLGLSVRTMFPAASLPPLGYAYPASEAEEAALMSPLLCVLSPTSFFVVFLLFMTPVSTHMRAHTHTMIHTERDLEERRGACCKRLGAEVCGREQAGAQAPPTSLLLAQLVEFLLGFRCTSFSLCLRMRARASSGRAGQRALERRARGGELVSIKRCEAVRQGGDLQLVDQISQREKSVLLSRPLPLTIHLDARCWCVCACARVDVRMCACVCARQQHRTQAPGAFGMIFCRERSRRSRQIACGCA